MSDGLSVSVLTEDIVRTDPLFTAPLSTVLGTVDAALAAAGLVRTGEPETVRDWMVSRVLRIPVAGGAVWFKAVPQLFAHEGAIIAWVAAVCPDVVPRLVGTGPGWLITEEMPAEVGAPRESALEALARVQHASVGRTAELRRLGCPDRSLGQLVRDLEELVPRADLLPPPLRGRMRAALPLVTLAVRAVDDLAIPDTLVHGDLQEDNARWTERGWLVIDWTDACVGNPFVEAARPLMHAGVEQWAHARSALTRAWEGTVPREALESALRWAPLLGAAHQLGTYYRIAEGIGRHDGFLELLEEWCRRLTDLAKTHEPYGDGT
jgi:hypothetical protein